MEAYELSESQSEDLVSKLLRQDPVTLGPELTSIPPVILVNALRRIPSARALDVIAHLPAAHRSTVEALVRPAHLAQWELNRGYPDGSLGRIMDPALAVFPEDVSVGEVIDRLESIVREDFVTYAFVVNPEGILTGVIVMRDLLFSDRRTPIVDVMVKNPFWLKTSATPLDAMRATIAKHFPVYPVCDADGRLRGEVRGSKLFEQQAVELSAQAGSMVGVEKEERAFTPWKKSFLYRHPWLQLNLITAFVAGAVVSAFEGTIDRFVILASFLPVLAGQSGNTGCQALAVTLRGLTLGDLKQGTRRKVIAKEALLGILNGFFVGLIAGGVMYFLAHSQGNENALMLSLIVMGAMVCSCTVSGVSGALIPLALRRLGADPATASSIFLTTATDVASMGLLLGLASMLL